MNYYPGWGPPPPWCYSPQQPMGPPPVPMNSTAKEFRQWMKAMEEWKKLQNGGDKKYDKPKERTFSAGEVLLILIATSPAIALLYKFLIIPSLLK